MWLVIVVIILVGAIWIAGHFLAIALTPKLIATGAVVVAAVGWRVAKRVLAIRAARKLEREIAQQAAAAPLARSNEVIDEMKKALAAGLTSQAQRHLPWYLVIGPTGDGKTSAIRNSGLDFPLLPPEDANEATEHVSFWFTDQAALVDTPGRYVTAAGRDEWLALLGELKSSRPDRPLSGVVVMVDGARLGSLEISDVELLSKRLRGCLDDVMTHLESVVPVYAFFTKLDKLDGFEEFFADLSEDERKAVLGVTLPKGGAENPGKALQAELARLVETLLTRALERAFREPRPALRGPLLRFPAQLESLSAQLSKFVGYLFGKNAFQQTPVFRGAYFASGAQGGPRVDRLFGAALAPFGIAIDGPTRTRPPGSTGYFVHDALANVAFTDGWIVAPTELARKRREQRTLRASAMLLGASTLLLLPSLSSHRKNVELAESTGALARGFTAGAPTVQDDESFAREAASLDVLRDRVQELEKWSAGSPPFWMRWGMYAGNDLLPAARHLYALHLKRAYIDPAEDELEAELRAGLAAGATADNVRNLYPSLKAYLMLADRKHLDPDWAAKRLARVWSRTSLARKMVPEQVKVAHATFYLSLIKSGELPLEPLESALIEKTRSALRLIPTVDRDYDALVRDASSDVAAITHESIFYGKVAGYVSARSGAKVDGAYTRHGWEMVRENLRNVRARTSAEGWVLGAAADGTGAGARDRTERLEAMYFERYKIAWRDFLADQLVERPQNAEIALDELSALTQPEWPYLRLARVLRDNTSLPMETPEAAAAASLVEHAETEATKLLGLDGGAPVTVMKSPVELAFEPLVRFGLPEQGPPGDKPPPTGLSQYETVLAKLIGVLTDLKAAKKSPQTETAAAQFEVAYRTVASLLAEQSPFTAPLLEPLLMNPISLAWGSVVRDATGVSGGVWELDVWRPLNGKLATKFPFVDGANGAALADFTEMFRPLTGTLWAFYERDLKASLPYEGGRFVPNKRFGTQPSYSAAFLKCLERARKITDAAFPPKSEVVSVPFEVRLHSVSPKISEVELTVDGKSIQYKNHPEQWVPITWPVADAKVRGGRLSVRGADDLREELSRPGDFGLLELLAAGERAAGTGTTFTGVFAFRSLGGATLSVDFRPTRTDNPFAPDLFTSLSCPKDIVLAR